MDQSLQGFTIHFIFHPNEITMVLKFTFEDFTLKIILVINPDLVLSNMGQIPKRDPILKSKINWTEHVGLSLAVKLIC